MLQVFSLKLSGTLAHSIDIYGTFAVHDCWEPRRNFHFNCSRDDPATIVPGTYLPLCSPCRGIFVLQYLLIDIDLWIKEEGEMSADKPLFGGYVGLDAQFLDLSQSCMDGFQEIVMTWKCVMLFYLTASRLLLRSQEKPNIQCVQISAFTGSFDDEIALYSGTFCGADVMVKHFVAVRKLEKLHVVLKLDGSVYTWTLQAGVRVLAAPPGPIPGFDQLIMGVSYRTRGKAASAWNIGDVWVMTSM